MSSSEHPFPETVQIKEFSPLVSPVTPEFAEEGFVTVLEPPPTDHIPVRLPLTGTADNVE